MLDYTDCDAVMIGRGAIGNPWIFGRQDRDNLLFCEVIEAIRVHLKEMLDYHGDPLGMILFRKHLKRYLNGLSPTDAICNQLVVAESVADFETLLADMEAKFGVCSVNTLAQSNEIQYLRS